MAYVYKHIRKDTNEVFYIGIAKKPYRRVSKVNRNNHWHNIVNKVGFISEIIDDNLTWEEACEREKYWIKFYGRCDLNEGALVNMTSGGEGFISSHSEHSKYKNKIAHLGRKATDETRRKMSIAKLNISEETREKYRIVSIGRFPSKETREKLKLAKLGKVMSNKTIEKIKFNDNLCKKVYQIDISNGVMYEWVSISEASRKLNIRRAGINNCCLAKQKTAGGFGWQYVNNI